MFGVCECFAVLSGCQWLACERNSGQQVSFSHLSLNAGINQQVSVLEKKAMGRQSAAKKSDRDEPMN